VENQENSNAGITGYILWVCINGLVGSSSLLCWKEHRHDGKLQNTLHQQCSHPRGSWQCILNLCIHSSNMCMNFSEISDLLPVCYP
jgi:hypothetical protein